MDYSGLRFWLDIFQLAGICIIGVYSWWANRERVTNKRFERQEKRLNALESEVKRFPSHSQLKELSDRIDRLHGDMREMSGSLKGLTRSVDLMSEHLINQGGKT